MIKAVCSVSVVNASGHVLLCVFVPGSYFISHLLVPVRHQLAHSNHPDPRCQHFPLGSVCAWVCVKAVREGELAGLKDYEADKGEEAERERPYTHSSVWAVFASESWVVLPNV